MVSYSVHGLRLKSNRAIPGLIAQHNDAHLNVQIWFRRLPENIRSACKTEVVRYTSSTPEDSSETNLIIYEIADGAYFWLRYADGTEFVFDRECTKVWATWPDHLTLEDTAMYFLGPVMGILLYLRGITCLHASSVVIGDSAIALVGASEAGKSTTAAAFAHLGYRVLSDDVVTLDERGDDVLVHPAYPYIRLWPSSVEMLYGKPDALPLLTPTWDKHCLHLIERGHQFGFDPAPLRAVYLLGDRSSSPEAPYVEALPPNEALMNLVINTYAVNLLDKQNRAREFDLLSRLMNRVIVRRVIPNEDPAQLFKLCRVIADDFNQLQSDAKPREEMLAAVYCGD